jgi:2,4-dienoyl-CoA reductase (NADPH2)
MVPRGSFVYLAAGIKEVVNIPVIASHRINDPVLADNIIKEGKTDMVAMARPLIADPELPKKAKEGRIDEIRTCIACNSCFDRVFEGSPITCLVNPAVGREREFKITRVNTPKKVVIVGGGPGGMEAARVAHLRGHNVSLYEKNGRLGGQVNLIAACPEMEEFANVPRYYKTQLKDVDIAYGVDVTPNFLIDQRPDAVIVATGASPIIPNIQGVKNKNVCTAFDLLKGKEMNGKKAIVVGGGGVGCDVALFLRSKGKDVTIVEMLDKIGNDIGRTTRWIIKDKLKENNIETITKARVIAIKDDGVVAERVGKTINIKGDTVVLAVGTASNKELYNALSGMKDRPGEIYLIGDALKPRKALDAISEGAEIAHKL